MEYKQDFKRRELEHELQAEDDAIRREADISRKHALEMWQVVATRDVSDIIKEGDVMTFYKRGSRLKIADGSIFNAGTVCSMISNYASYKDFMRKI